MTASKRLPGSMNRRRQEIIVSEISLSLVNSLQVSDDTVAVLEDLLAMARAGDIREVTWAARDSRGGKIYGYAGQAYDDPLGVAGVVGKLQMALMCHGFNPCGDS